MSVPVRDIRPALPVARPGKIICLGLNHVEHVKEGGHDIPSYPALFLRTRTSVMPAGAPMVRPGCSERLDYEAELMVVVGQGGRHIGEAEALAHVFGYTVFNDGSVRDYQRKTHQWTPGKNFDQTGAIGPVVVTPDELPAGATYLTANAPGFAALLERAEADRAPARWPTPLPCMHKGAVGVVGLPGMSGFARSLGKTQDVRLGVTVTTVSAPQALHLLGQDHSLAKAPIRPRCVMP